MKPASPHACDAWQLLTQLFFAERGKLPPLAAELELSPAQCHVLHLIEPGRPLPMGSNRAAWCVADPRPRIAG